MAPWSCLFRCAPSKVASGSLVDYIRPPQPNATGKSPTWWLHSGASKLGTCGDRGKTSMAFQMLRLCGRSGRSRVLKPQEGRRSRGDPSWSWRDSSSPWLRTTVRGLPAPNRCLGISRRQTFPSCHPGKGEEHPIGPIWCGVWGSGVLVELESIPLSDVDGCQLDRVQVPDSCVRLGLSMKVEKC